jgi:hypothetical protein
VIYEFIEISTKIKPEMSRYFWSNKLPIHKATPLKNYNENPVTDELISRLMLGEERLITKGYDLPMIQELIMLYSVLIKFAYLMVYRKLWNTMMGSGTLSGNTSWRKFK